MKRAEPDIIQIHYIYNNIKPTCVLSIIEVDKELYLIMKCLSKDRNNNNCRNHRVDETRFCKLHQYMNEYTDAMLEELTLCSGCLKMYYMGDSGFICCVGCRSREKLKPPVILCKSENCKFKRSNENEYCGKH